MKQREYVGPKRRIQRAKYELVRRRKRRWRRGRGEITGRGGCKVDIKDPAGPLGMGGRGEGRRIEKADDYILFKSGRKRGRRMKKKGIKEQEKNVFFLSFSLSLVSLLPFFSRCITGFAE